MDGPIYHGGTQIIVNEDAAPIRSWIDILGHTPYKTPVDQKYVVSELERLTEGFVATADSPLAQCVEEMMEIYPEAKVICTVRNPDA